MAASVGVSALHHAARSGDMGKVRESLELGQCSVDCGDSDGWTPLHYACEAGHLDVVRGLVSEFGADVCIQSVSDGITALMLAVRCGHADIATVLLRDYQCPVDTRDKRNRTALHYACAVGDIGVIETLVKHKANLNACDDENDMPLHVAARGHETEVVASLICKFGCNPKAKGHNDRSVLHYACLGGNVSLVKALVSKHKADDNACECDGGDMDESVPLSLAAFEHDPDVQMGNGDSPLHLACREGHAAVCTVLVPVCCLYATNDDGDTPLHVAAANNRIGCVMVLLSANAPILVRNKSGKTPADLATPEVEKLLKKYLKDHGGRLQDEYKATLVHVKEVYSSEHRIVRLYVVGSPGAGKSSFVESLKREGFLKSLQRVSESAVPPHTAGIIPMEYYSKQFGRVLLYDFAGDVEYYSSHAAILESISSSTRGDHIFLVVVNLLSSNHMIKSQLDYWVAFIQQQKFPRKYFGIVGSHYDSATAKHTVSDKLLLFKKSLGKNARDFLILGNGYFLMNCCNPRSDGISILRRHIFTQTRSSKRYQLSPEASILLGVLKKDFGGVVACSLDTIQSHIKDSGVALPCKMEALRSLFMELHEMGVFLLLGDGTKEDSLMVIDSSKLTNKVHKLLFSGHAVKSITESMSSDSESAECLGFSIGVVSESHLDKILPPYITKECLLQLQYCQEIKHTQIKLFLSLDQHASKLPVQSYYFFPAMCSSDRSNTSWDTDPVFSCDIGWLARCTDICDYFPPRFIHVLLLRLVFRFTLSVSDSPDPAPGACPESSSFNLHCTMWKTGVQWSMEEGVKCRVEMVNGNKGVVVLTRSIEDNTENLTSVFNDVIHCVKEAKAEFCHHIKPEFFLLDSTSEADYLSDENLFSMSDVNRVLKDPRGKKMVYSKSRKSYMGISKLSFVRRKTWWEFLFPINLEAILTHFKGVHISNLLLFGLRLGLPEGEVLAIEANFPLDANRRLTEVLKVWMSSTSLGFPCWWRLVEALEDVERDTLAKEIASFHDDVGLQKQLLEGGALKPDILFLESFAAIVGGKWPSLASSLSLSENEIEEVRKEGEELGQAFQMLKQWVQREDATYSLLCQTLKTASLSQL